MTAVISAIPATPGASGITAPPAHRTVPRPRLRALVLAAGRGERLRPLTATLPKPLLPVAGRPLLAHALERLRTAGCEAVAINLHHLGGQIREQFGDRFRGMPLVWSEEPELLGTAGALPPLRPFLEQAERVLVVNGDTLCRWPIEALLAAHARRQPAATLLVHRKADPRAFGGGVALEDDGITAFRPGSLAYRSARTTSSSPAPRSSSPSSWRASRRGPATWSPCSTSRSSPRARRSRRWSPNGFGTTSVLRGATSTASSTGPSAARIRRHES